MKNNKPTHCQEEIIKQGKFVCGLESTEELLEEEVVCTTSLKHEEPNKWSHDQNENEAEIHKTGSQEAASHDQGNSFSLADDMLNHSFEMMHFFCVFFTISVSCERSLSLHARFIFFSKTLGRQIPFLVFKTLKRKAGPIFIPRLLYQQAGNELGIIVFLF